MNLRYPGQVADAESGLYNNWHRVYDPRLGRYLTPDPLGPLAGMRHAAQVRAYLATQPVGLEHEGNPYAYGRNNPLRYIDPYGLWALGDPLPQGLVDAVTGFGDGSFSAITLGLGDLRDIRDFAGIDGGINSCSSLYGGFNTAGNIVGGVALGGAVGSEAGLSAWARRYPNAGGGGIGVDRAGENLIRLDWHKFKVDGSIVSRPHIDIPGFVKHWPWK